MRMRVGEGIDRHRLVEGQPLRLGGIAIEHSHGLAGHSDGDAVLHALCDALLGSLALGDLGQLFSDEAEENRGRDSAEFVREVMSHVRESGFALVNADLTIMAEAPRLAPHVMGMRSRVAELCGCAADQISIKATRGEGLGPEGRGEAITVRALVLVEREAGA